MVDILFYKRKTKKLSLFLITTQRGVQLRMILQNICGMFRCIYKYMHVFMYPCLSQAQEFVQVPFCLEKDTSFPLNLLDIRGNKHHHTRAAHSFWKMSRACCHRSRWCGTLCSVLLWGCVFLQNSLQLSSPMSIFLVNLRHLPPVAIGHKDA